MVNFFSQLNNKLRLPLSKELPYAIVAGFLAVMLLVAFALASGYRTSTSIESLVSEIVDKNNKKIELIHGLGHAARERLILLHKMSNEPDPFVRDEALSKYYAFGQQFLAGRHELEAQAVSSGELQIQADLKKVLEKLHPTQIKILDALSNEDVEAAISIIPKFEALQSELTQVLGQYSDLEESFRREASIEIKNIFDHSQRQTILLSIILLVGGTLVSFTVVRFVITQQKKLIDMNNTLESFNHVLLLSTKESERANKNKLEFIANMSHELRTPMTAIKGSLGILNSGMIENIPDEASELISMADKNTDQLIGLVTDVLDFSKLEANEIEIVKGEFIIHQEIEKFLIPFYRKARNKSIKLEVSYSEKMPMSVTLDQTHLFQILTQLISNALKFTEEGEVLLKVEFREDSRNIVFHIIDTGIGLAEDEIHHLFESFVQGDGSSTRKFGGTGIGLAICKKLIDALEGEIKVSSEKEKGSTFSLSIPVDVAA